MEELTYLFGQIMEEIGDAEGYAKKAHAWKLADPSLSSDLVELAKGEMAHADKLMAHAERIVKAKMTDSPVEGGMASQMLAWVKESAAEQSAHAKSMIDMYKK